LRENGNIASDPLLSFVLRELREYRERLQTLINFDLVPIPLVKNKIYKEKINLFYRLAYPQVVFIAVRTYFLICLFSRQKIQTTTNNVDSLNVL